MGHEALPAEIGISCRVRGLEGGGAPFPFWQDTCSSVATAGPLAATNMTCKETMQLLCEYLEGRLVSSVVRELRQHLDHCDACQIVLNAARWTLEAHFR